MDSLEDLSRRQAETQNQLEPTRARPQPWFVGGGARLTGVIVVVVGLLIATRVASTLWMAGAAWDWWTHRPAPPTPAPVLIWRSPAERPLPAEGIAAKAIGDEAHWIIADDYPADSIRREETGTVRIRWLIDDRGRVRQCGILESSGYPRLDDAACRAISTRARYRPARDATGRAIETTRQRTVRWQLPI